MSNPLIILEKELTKQSQVNGMINELNEVIQSGTAEHFIKWHNSKVTANNHISPDWYKQYLTENGL